MSDAEYILRYDCVTRYGEHDTYAEMALDDHGDYVAYEDYARLAAELTQAECMSTSLAGDLGRERIRAEKAEAELAEVRDQLDRRMSELADGERDYQDALAAILGLRMELEKRDAELAQARADAERVEYCARNALALDFAYGEDGRCAVVIEIPKDARYSVGFRDIIDAARATDSAGGE